MGGYGRGDSPLGLGTVTDRPDGRSPLALAAEWSTRITTVALEMVLPGLGGYWLDRRWDTLPAMTVVGMLMGMALGGWQLTLLVRDAQRRETPSDLPPTSERGDPPRR